MQKGRYLMGNNNWKITCLHYGTLSCYKSLFDGGLDQARYPFVYSGYLLQKDNRNILVDTGVHQDNIIDGKAWANSPAEGGNQYVLARIIPLYKSLSFKNKKYSLKFYKYFKEFYYICKDKKR